MLRRSIQWQSLLSNIRNIATATSTVDNQEIQHFKKLTDEWWNEFGPTKPLHSMNKLRVPFIRDGLLNEGTINSDRINTPTTLKGISILDVGCGGGILTESLARLGGNITGIDANESIIHIAKSHAKLNDLEISYIVSSIEEHAPENVEKYDAVIASEILEHITEKEKFLSECVKCLKPTGSIFITTLNKTPLANFMAIFLGENVFNLIPKGTHQYEKFIDPLKVQRMLEDYNCRTRLLHGTFYNGLSNTWHWCSSTSIFYALQAVKLKQCK